MILLARRRDSRPLEMEIGRAMMGGWKRGDFKERTLASNGGLGPDGKSSVRGRRGTELSCFSVGDGRDGHKSTQVPWG